MAIDLAKDKIVLDIACGEGYGCNLLAKVGKSVIGVDISSETIQEAQNKYVKDNIEFKVGSADKIPCEDNFFDFVPLSDDC